MSTALEILHEKIINNPIKNLHWCNSMDLIAVITKTNDIQVLPQFSLLTPNSFLKSVSRSRNSFRRKKTPRSTSPPSVLMVSAYSLLKRSSAFRVPVPLRDQRRQHPDCAGWGWGKLLWNRHFWASLRVDFLHKLEQLLPPGAEGDSHPG